MSNPRPMLPIDLAAAGIIVGAAALTYLVGIAPGRAAAQAAARDQVALAAKEGELQSLLGRIKDKHHALESLQTELDSSEHVLHPATEQFARLGSINELANSCTIRLTETKPGQAVAGKRFNQVPIHLAGTGAYPNIADFLNLLHARFEDLQVASFNLTSKADDHKNPPRFEAELIWYTSAEPAAKPAPAANTASPNAAGSVGPDAHKESGTGASLSNPAAPPSSGSP